MAGLFPCHIFFIICSSTTRNIRRNCKFWKRNLPSQNALHFDVGFEHGVCAANITGETSLKVLVKQKKYAIQVWCTFRDSNPGPTD